MMSRYQAGAVKGGALDHQGEKPVLFQEVQGHRPLEDRNTRGFREASVHRQGDLRGAYPLGPMSVPEERVVRVHSSSGTTGAPVIIPYTARDADDRAITFERRYGMAGVTPTDRIWITPGHGP